MDTTTLLGLLAGGLTTACWAPQLTRSIRTRSLHDLSWAYLLVLDTGIALWLVYGLLAGDAAIIAANAVTLVAVLTLTALKWRCASAPSQSADMPPLVSVAPGRAGSRRPVAMSGADRPGAHWRATAPPE